MIGINPTSITMLNSNGLNMNEKTKTTRMNKQYEPYANKNIT